MQSIFSNPYPGREDFAQWRPLMVPNGLAGRRDIAKAVAQLRCPQSGNVDGGAPRERGLF